jgi:hypothetical protein
MVLDMLHVKLINCVYEREREKERERERGWVNIYISICLCQEIPTAAIKKETSRMQTLKQSPKSTLLCNLVNKQTKHSYVVIATRSGARGATYHKFEFTRVFTASVRTQCTIRCLVPGPHVLEQAPHGSGSQ